MSLNGKTVLITGGARGVGAQTARVLVSRGAQVVLCDVDLEPLEQIGAELGDSAAVTAADVTDFAEMERVAALAVERFGGIDVVVANAGIASYGSVEAVDPATFKRVIDINVTGVFHTVRAALPHVIERRGYVLIVSSLAAYAPAPGLAAYNASKAGVEHLANAMRLEVAHKGSPWAVHMSWIDTPMVQDAKADLTAFQQMLKSLPGPLGATTSVEQCAVAFADGIEKRSRQVNVPGWVGTIRWLKPLLSTRLASLRAGRDAARLVPLMDEEVARLGRSASTRVKLPEHADA